MSRWRPFPTAAWQSQAGQIVIPSLFIFPSLMLFVFLIFETAKLSREKIRHQFAIDAAGFVEMTNYSDFLNRTAYVNGPFPMRIFYEGFADTQLSCLGRSDQGQCSGTKSLADVLYADGVFPRDPSDPSGASYSGNHPAPWPIQYDDGDLDSGSESGRQMQSADPSVGSCLAPAAQGNSSGATQATGSNNSTYPDCVTIVSMRTAKAWNINWDDANQIYKLYVQIYQLLGSVEAAQYSVLKRLSADHNFFTKSYWLNIGDSALTNPPTFYPSANLFMSGVHFACAQYVLFMGNQIVTNVLGQPYQIWASVGDNGPPQMPNTITDPSGCTGLFQVATVNQGVLNSMNMSGGWPVSAHWAAPSNFFNVDVNAMMAGVDNGPIVQATVHVASFPPGAQVWPNPTPKFQVRTTP